MRAFLRKLWQQHTLLYLLLVPVVLLPIALVDPQPKWECAYLVMVMACYWVPEAIPIAVTSLLPLIILPMFGIITAKNIAKSYMSDSTLVFLGGMVIATSVETWNLHKRIALRILLLVGTDPRWLMLGLMFSTWILSMWMSNTATTAMMIPITRAILGQLKQQTGTDQNLASEPAVEPTSNGYQRMCKGLTLSIAYAANVGGIATLTGTGTNIVLKGQSDVLYAHYGVRNPVTFGLWMVFALPLSFVLLLLAWGWLQLFFLPKKCRSSCCRKQEVTQTKDTVKALIREEYKQLGPITYAEYSVLALFLLLAALWISRDLGGVGGWGRLFPSGFVSDATPAILCSVLLFMLPSHNPLRTGSSGVTVSRLLSWKQFNSKMPWSIVLLLGGGFALAKGCEVSGLSEWVGEKFESLTNLNTIAILFILCYVVAGATQVTSNIAIATLLLPVLKQLALSTRVNPLFYMFPATLSASLAFLLPVATPPNAIVFASGYVKVVDMVLAGLVLNILAVPFVVLATATWGKALFSLDSFPDYFTNGTSGNNTALAS